MIAILAHAAPAKVEVAAEAVHVRASSVLLDPYFAVGALAHILKKEETPKPHNAFAWAGPLMPWSLALEACIFATLLGL